MISPVPSRRSILAAASGGVMTTLAPGLRAAFAADGAPASGNILIVAFMRGGQDGLQVAAPAGAPEYIASRPRIRVDSSGTNAGTGIGTLDGVDFYFHPTLAPLKPLYDAGKLAVVQAVGVPTIDRSHFVVQDLMERGLGGGEAPAGATGWLARHLASRGGARSALGTIATSTVAPQSLAGDRNAVAVSDPVYFNLLGGERTTASLVAAVNAGADPYQQAVRSLVKTVFTVQDRLGAMQTQGTLPADDGGYGYSDFGDALRGLATLIKMDVGLDTAAVDMSGWDHHTGLNGAFNIIGALFAQALTAFWMDLGALQSRVTIVTMTEFGRRFAENSNAGLDHGAASTMLVLGGGVAGGKLYGSWPGLTESALDNGSLRVTTDYRQVLAEVIAKQHGERNLAGVFPRLSYAPIGVAF